MNPGHQFQDYSDHPRQHHQSQGRAHGHPNTGLTGLVKPQNTGNQIQLRPSMREVFGRNRDGQRGGDEGWNQGPGITMGEVFGRSRTQVEDQKGPNDGPTHLAPRAAMGAKFWKLERTILVNREPVQDEEYGTKATAPWMPELTEETPQQGRGLFGSTPALTGNRQSRSFFKKCLYLVASKLSLEVVPFWKTQANSGDQSATMFLIVLVFFSCVQLEFRYLVMLWVYVVFVAFSWGIFFCRSCFLISDFCTFNCI